MEGSIDKFVKFKVLKTLEINFTVSDVRYYLKRMMGEVPTHFLTSSITLL